jgi:hypothetical protein
MTTVVSSDVFLFENWTTKNTEFPSSIATLKFVVKELI